MIRRLSHDNFSDLVNPNNISVIKLGHDGCPLCVNLTPVYEEMAEIYEDDEIFDFFEIDVIADDDVLVDRMRAGNPSDNPGVPEIWFYHLGIFKEIPWPDQPSSSGYSIWYLKSFFDNFKWFRSYSESCTKF